jgi:hypothetical protein
MGQHVRELVDEGTAAGHERDVDLRLKGIARAYDIDVGAGLDLGAFEDRVGAGYGADDVGPGDRLAQLAAGFTGRPIETAGAAAKARQRDSDRARPRQTTGCPWPYDRPTPFWPGRSSLILSH